MGEEAETCVCPPKALYRVDVFIINTIWPSRYEVCLFSHHMNANLPRENRKARSEENQGLREGRRGEDKGKQMDRVSQRCRGFKMLSATKEQERNLLAGNNRMKWHQYETQVFLPGAALPSRCSGRKFYRVKRCFLIRVDCFCLWHDDGELAKEQCLPSTGCLLSSCQVETLSVMSDRW